MKTWAGHVVRMKEIRNGYIFVEKPGGRLLERPRSRWDDNIKIRKTLEDRAAVCRLG